MTEEEQNKAIAAACGRLYHRPSDLELKSGSYYQFEPSYTRDLNYMHEAQTVLTEHQRYLYMNHIADTEYKLDDAWEYLNATAAQRAEALLRALNLWKN